MASGGHVDRIAAEHGVFFVPHTTTPDRHQSRARRKCQKILSKHGPDHLRLVFGLMNNETNRGNWEGRCFVAVSRLIENNPELEKNAKLVDIMDRIDLAALLTTAKRTNPRALTTALTVLLAYEVDRLIAEQEKEQAA